METAPQPGTPSPQHLAPRLTPSGDALALAARQPALTGRANRLAIGERAAAHFTGFLALLDELASLEPRGVELATLVEAGLLRLEQRRYIYRHVIAEHLPG